MGGRWRGPEKVSCHWHWPALSTLAFARNWEFVNWAGFHIHVYRGEGCGCGRDAKKAVTVVSTHVLFCFHHLGYFWDVYRQCFDIYVLILRLCMCSSSQFVQQAQSLACAINTHVKLAQLCYFLGCVETRPCVIFGLCSAHSVQSLWICLCFFVKLLPHGLILEFRWIVADLIYVFLCRKSVLVLCFTLLVCLEGDIRLDSDRLWDALAALTRKICPVHW